MQRIVQYHGTVKADNLQFYRMTVLHAEGRLTYSNDSNYENKKFFFPLAKLNAPMVPSFR